MNVSAVRKRPAALLRSLVQSTAAAGAVCFVVTLAVMLVGIGHRHLWRDEHATWWAASLPLTDLHRLVGTVDVVLYPYYLLMHFWIALFGDSPAMVRAPSALFMAVAAALLPALGRRLFDAPTGLTAGLLLPLIPAISRYGQEARPYAMALAATVTAVLLLMRALERRTVLRWAGYAGAVLWMAGSHAVTLLSLVAHGVAVLAAVRAESPAHRLRPLADWSLALIGAGLAAAPLIVVGARQAGQISWVPDPVWARVAAFPADLFTSSPVAAAVIVLGSAALARTLTERTAQWYAAALVAVWALVPPVFAYCTFDQLGFFYPRYLLFTIPAWVLAAAWGLRSLTSAERGGAAVTLVVMVVLGLGALPQQRHVRSARLHNEIAFAAGARYLGERVLDGDGVVYTGYAEAHRGFRYELRRAGKPVPREVLAVPPPGRPWSWKRVGCAAPVACLAGVRRIGWSPPTRGAPC